MRSLWKGVGPNVARNALINAAELASYDQVGAHACARPRMHTCTLLFPGPACRSAHREVGCVRVCHPSTWPADRQRPPFSLPSCALTYRQAR